jgi:hypothetical protein
MPRADKAGDDLFELAVSRTSGSRRRSTREAAVRSPGPDAVDELLTLEVANLA